ncbi:MAG: tetratricopeptide repeat protein [Gammaproteobacteria bacterium]|nr:tetratricopeptide repeat protein [Gammaproteobacteria bacterium]
MRAVIVLLVMLALTVGLMLQIREDSGYVLLSYGQYSLETSLVVLVVALAALFIGLYFLLRAAIGTFRIPQTAREFNRRRLRARASEELQQGLLQLSEGNWAQAQKSLGRHAGDSRMAIVHYLSAARAAQLAHDTEGRDAWLGKAYETNPQAEVAIGLAKAELQLQEKQYVHALATLRRLREKTPKHPYVLRLLAQTHIQLNEWQELEQLLAELENSKAFDKEGMQAIRQQLWLQRLEQITAIALEGRKEIAGEHISALWKKTTRTEREDADRLVHFAKAHHASGQDAAAASLIEPILKKRWHEQAVALYGWLDLNQKRALKTIEQWLKHYGDQPVLLLTAAQVCIRYQLWGRARSWLTHLTTTQPSEAAWRELAALEETQGNNAAAANAWRAAASMGGNTVTPLLPQAPNLSALESEENTDFAQPDIAGPECIPSSPYDAEETPSSTEEDSDNNAEDDQLELPVTPAAAYSNESKNS